MGVCCRFHKYFCKNSGLTNTNQPRRILVAPLDWGLGHTTRCIPIISEIVNSGHSPLFAGNGAQLSFIEKIFPNIEKTLLPGYDVVWPGGLKPFFAQIPKIMRAIGDEHRWLQKQAHLLQLDGIISDNRYGLYHSKIPNIILTHQLGINTGSGQVANAMATAINYKYLNRFNKVWVVANPGKVNLSGPLSAPKRIPDHAEYIGLLSRYADVGRLPPTGTRLLILLSGPEPQRSILSDLLWQQVHDMTDDITFIEGADVVRTATRAGILHFGRLAQQELLTHLRDARFVVCRSGYSTLMDLTALGRCALTIPTPGQTEQEYLAAYLSGKRMFGCIPQDGIDLGGAVRLAQDAPFEQPIPQSDFLMFKPILKRWVESL